MSLLWVDLVGFIKLLNGIGWAYFDPLLEKAIIALVVPVREHVHSGVYSLAVAVFLTL